MTVQETSSVCICHYKLKYLLKLKKLLEFSVWGPSDKLSAALLPPPPQKKKKQSYFHQSTKCFSMSSLNQLMCSVANSILFSGTLPE